MRTAPKHIPNTNEKSADYRSKFEQEQFQNESTQVNDRRFPSDTYFW